MSTVSINPASHTDFVEKFHDAFLDGDDAAADKQVEAENVRRLQEQYRALARGDFGPLVAGMADDIDMEMVGTGSVPG